MADWCDAFAANHDLQQLWLRLLPGMFGYNGVQLLPCAIVMSIPGQKCGRFILAAFLDRLTKRTNNRFWNAGIRFEWRRCVGGTYGNSKSSERKLLVLFEIELKCQRDTAFAAEWLGQLEY